MCWSVLVVMLVPLAPLSTGATASTVSGPGQFVRRSLLEEVPGQAWAAVPPSGQSILAPGWQDALDDGVPSDLPYGTRGTKRMHYGGGLGLDLNDDDPMLDGGIGWSYFIEDGFSFDLELKGAYFAQDIGDNALGINANLLLRWHFHRAETWSMYADGGAGLMLTTAHVPAQGSGFNFTPQLGLGMSFELESQRRLLTGVRWHHVSNGSTFRENDARDSVYVYAMISIPY